MNDFNLNYSRDMDGNYIVKQRVGDATQYRDYLKNTGTYSENIVISTKYFEKKLRHKIDDMVKDLEETVILQHRIYDEDIIYKKFIATVTPEQEFNPLFQKMSDVEIAEYTANSMKVRVVIKFEMHIKTQKHLLFSSILNSLKEIWR